MIHGATVRGWEYDRLTPLLNAAGFRTYAPDLYGHGRSARPKTRYDHELFIGQMEEFLQSVVGDKPVAVIGHSLGAAGAPHAFIITHPQQGVAPILGFLSSK